MFKNIVGMDSAYKHAKSLKPYSNMGISTRLVVDMHNEILALRKRVAELGQLYSELSETGYDASKVLALLPQLLHSIEIRDWYSIPMLLSEAKEKDDE